MPSRTAILLVAHGSRRPQANDDLKCVAEDVSNARPDDLVEVAYLELAQPTIPEAAKSCVDRGATRVVIVPYFLSAGEHVKKDLEEFRRRFVGEFPEAEFLLCPPLGPHTALTQIVLDRVRDAVE